MPYRKDEKLRPGFVILDMLTKGKRASIAEMHREYKDRINARNEGLKKCEKYKNMTYHAFASYVQRAKIAGMIRRVAEKPLEYAPSDEVADALRMIREGIVVPSRQVLYSLTKIGKDTPEAFVNLQKWLAG